MNNFLLLLGSSGVGKTSIINELIKLDNRFIYISPFTTRKLRKKEGDKISISSKKMREMWNNGKFLAVNKLYGISYATPWLPIIQALSKGNFPILDWPTNQIKVMKKIFPNQLYIVYVAPPSIKVLKQRLAKDGRDLDGNRLQNARKEWKAYQNSQYTKIYDFRIVSKENQILEIAHTIYFNYLQFSSK